MLLLKRNMRKLLLLFFCVFVCHCQENSTVLSEEETNIEETTTVNSVISTELPVSSTTDNIITLVTDKSLTGELESSTIFREASTRHEISTIVPVSSSVGPQTNTSDILEKWKHLENLTKIFSKGIVKRILPGLIEGTDRLNISASCRRDFLRFLIGFRDIKTWAYSLIDASAKVVDGMLSGTLSSLGEYDQCLDIEATKDRRGKKGKEVMFTGQYCAIDMKPPIPPKKKFYKLNDVVDELKEFAKGDNIINEAAKAAQFFNFVSLRTGICVPSGCHASDIQQLVDIVAKEIHWDVIVKRCEVKQENEYTPLIIAVMTAMCFFGFLLVVGSLIDLYHKYAQKKINNLFLEILVCFSFVHNFKKLVSTKNAQGNMSCLNGIRFLSISWIVLAHTYLNTNYVLSKNLKQAMFFQQDFFFQAIVNASVAVDSFFFLGGFLVCYVTVKVIRETQKPFSILLYILHRLFRLLPVYIMVILFMYLAPILGSGPVYYDTIDSFLNACYKNWWTNILFVNNFVNTDAICLPQSWYVACDMQLYIAALIVILPILRWPWVGLSIASLGVLASIGGTAAMTYFYEYPPTMLFIHPDIEQRLAYWANAYFKPYSHAGPYCIGLIVGYVLATHPKLKFSLITRIFGWTLAVGCNMAVLYGVYEWNVGRDPELIETLLYSSLHRVAWTYGVAWIVICCATGCGGVVNYILSWKVWIPLGRLTYAIYLIHPIAQIAAVGNARMNVQIKHYFIVWIFFGHLMITIGSAFAASMLVEAPFISLEKLLLRAIGGKPKSIANGHASIPNGSPTLHSTDSEENVNTIPKNEPVSHL